MGNPKADVSPQGYFEKEQRRRDVIGRAGTILIDEEDKRFLLVECYFRCWGFPKGKREHGESVFECAQRETLEETSLYITPEDVLEEFETQRYDKAVYYVIQKKFQRINAQEIAPDVSKIGWFCASCVSQLMLNSHTRYFFRINDKMNPLL